VDIIMELYVQHIGLVAANATDYIARLNELFGCKEVKPRLIAPNIGQNSCLVELGQGSYCEIMEPNGEVGTVPKYLATHGEGFHHIGMYCSDPVELAKILEAAGARILGDPTTGGFFVHPKSTGGLLVEISSTKDLEREV